MENMGTTLYAVFGNLILKNHPVKIKLKKNKITVVTIQFSSQPIYPPSLLFSRQYFIIQRTKGRKKKCKQKKEWPLRSQIHSTFLLLCNIRLLCVHVPRPEFCTPIAPKSWKAIGKRKREKFSIPAAAARNWAMNPPEELEDTEEQGAVCYTYSGFGSAAQKCLLHTATIKLVFLDWLLSKGTTKHSFWLKPLKNSL